MGGRRQINKKDAFPRRNKSKLLIDDRKRRQSPGVASLSRGRRDSRRSGGHERVKEEKKTETRRCDRDGRGNGGGRGREGGSRGEERSRRRPRRRKLDVRVKHRITAGVKKPRGGSRGSTWTSSRASFSSSHRQTSPGGNDHFHQGNPILSADEGIEKKKYLQDYDYFFRI